MDCGASTSCFYPMDTLEAIGTLQDAGVKTAEVFLNTFSELEDDFVARMGEQLARSDMKVYSLHPFSSILETFFFASMYDMRVQDGLVLYRRIFALCRRLSIPLMVFHGDHLQTPFPFARHCANFARVRDLGREYGVELCQENVSRCKCGRADYILRMRDVLHDDVSFVLDVKQMRRANETPAAMLQAMEGHIRHLHLSDATPLCDCAVPGTGTFDFEALFRALRRQQYAGEAVVELYRGDFGGVQDLCSGAAAVNEAWQRTGEPQQAG